MRPHYRRAGGPFERWATAASTLLLATHFYLFACRLFLLRPYDDAFHFQIELHWHQVPGLETGSGFHWQRESEPPPSPERLSSAIAATCLLWARCWRRWIKIKVSLPASVCVHMWCKSPGSVCGWVSVCCVKYICSFTTNTLSSSLCLYCLTLLHTRQVTAVISCDYSLSKTHTCPSVCLC